jgi:cyclopropane fatty-acyl-phospholipid synthase-like methyltransferase
MSDHYTGGAYWATRRGARSDYKVPLVLNALAAAGIGLRDEMSVLEVGCGNGAFLWPFSEAVAQNGVRPVLHGIDIAANAIDEAQQVGGANPPRFICSSLESHPGEYDLVLAIDVVEHVPCPLTFLSELRRFAPTLLLHLPIEHSILHLMTRRPTASYRAYRHIHFFSLESARLLIQEAGWQVKGVRHSAADAATLKLQSSPLLRVARSARYLAYKAMPRATTIVAGGSVMVWCERSGSSPAVPSSSVDVLRE